jgi:hypothetical protein
MGTVTCPLLLTVLDGGIFTSILEVKIAFFTCFVNHASKLT